MELTLPQPLNQLDDLIPPCNLLTTLFLSSLLALSTPLGSPAPLVPPSSFALPLPLTPSISLALPQASSPPARLCEADPLAVPQASRPMSSPWPASPSALPWLYAPSAHPAGSTLVFRHPGFPVHLRASSCTSAPHPFGSTRFLLSSSSALVLTSSIVNLFCQATISTLAPQTWLLISSALQLYSPLQNSPVTYSSPASYPPPRPPPSVPPSINGYFWYLYIIIPVSLFLMFLFSLTLTALY